MKGSTFLVGSGVLLLAVIVGILVYRLYDHLMEVTGEELWLATRVLESLATDPVSKAIAAVAEQLGLYHSAIVLKRTTRASVKYVTWQLLSVGGWLPAVQADGKSLAFPGYSIEKTLSSVDPLPAFTDKRLLLTEGSDEEVIDQIMDYFNEGSRIYSLYGVDNCTSPPPVTKMYGLTCENFTASVLKLFDVPDPFPHHNYYIVFTPPQSTLGKAECFMRIPISPVPTDAVAFYKRVSTVRTKEDLATLVADMTAGTLRLPVFSYASYHYETAAIYFLELTMSPGNWK